MSDPQPLPLWFIPFFPLIMVGMWALIIGFIAELGWRELARLYPEPKGIVRDPVRTFGMASMDLRRGWFPLPVNYGNCVVLEVASAGLHLRVWRILGFRHAPLLIPWNQVERFEAGRVFFWRTLTVHPRGTSVRLRLYGSAAQAVEEVAHQLAARHPQPAPV